MTATPTPPPTTTPAAPAAPAEEDSYLWLEEVSGEKALGWVKAQNERSLAELGTPEHAALKQRLLSIYDSKARIPHVSKKGNEQGSFAVHHAGGPLSLETPAFVADLALAIRRS